MSEKLCVFCTHLDFDTFGCYGRYPDPAYFVCEKGHEMHHRPDKLRNYEPPAHRAVYSVEDMRAITTTAQTCPDYDQVKP